MENTKQIKEQLLNFKHDIRNPLYIAKSLIETHLEYLEDVSCSPVCMTSPKTKLILGQSAKEIDRVLKLIRKLNQIAGNGCASKIPNERSRRVYVKEILHGILTALKEGHYLEHLMLAVSIPSDLQAIEINSVDLEEIFFNLIVNAAQATMPGGQLMIQAFYQTEPLRAVRISFEDTGHGISEKALPHIFEPFYTDRAEAGGVGFGLYIVKQLVERNGGKITVESKRNIGTTFTLTFPLEKKRQD